jgi:hypothetical protein
MIYQHCQEIQTWAYPYKPSFRRRAEELSFLTPAIEELPGNAWQIPDDGRVDLKFSYLGLELDQLYQQSIPAVDQRSVPSQISEDSDVEIKTISEIRDDAVSTLKRLAEFDRKLFESDERDPFIIDYDP